MSIPFETLRAGAPDCPSDFALDRLFSGELEHVQKRALESHLYDCAVCKARMAQRRAGFDAFTGFDAKRLYESIEAKRPQELTPRKKRAPFWLGSLGFIAAAALALLMVRPRASLPTSEAEQTTRLKGGLSLRVHRLRDGLSEEVLSGSSFRAGDRIRFQVSTPKRGVVSIVGIEADRTLYTAWPANGVPRELPESVNVLLEGAVELDAAPGHETLWLVLCELSSPPSVCRSRGTDPALECPSGCMSTSFVMDKRP